jgi:hypothetical protein
VRVNSRSGGDVVAFNVTRRRGFQGLFDRVTRRLTHFFTAEKYLSPETEMSACSPAGRSGRVGGSVPLPKIPKDRLNARLGCLEWCRLIGRLAS